MNAKHPIEPRARPSLRQAMCWALVLSSMISTPVLSAQTDISSSPITSTNAAQVKPNIMLLVDASGSMGWGHMPDEMESEVGIGSIGYKAAQCNVVYYNPNQTYAIPRQADGTPFATPSFTGAPYDGYAAFNGASAATVDLSQAFKAYDDNTLRTSGYNDTPQPAYYYTYTPNSGTAPIVVYDSAPCTDGDVNTSVPSNDGPAPNGGTWAGNWTRVVVGSNTGVGGSDERQNFAIWYTYYRTRILLIKSAASLAFTPLTDSFRVGFITVKPKDHPTDVAINPNAYLAIDDFNTTQRGLWFSKVFSTKPSGSSPMREGLARVGRMYAGKHDGINQGMNDDPVQYSCQQNFTIMTTDGYWNAQDESTAQGSYLGGPVDISGQTLVGQQDGSLNANTTNNPSPPPATDFNGTPRPIWDGTFDGLRTITNKTVAYAYAPCGTYFNMTTTQLVATTSQLQQTTSQSLQNTAQVLQSTSQMLQSSTQMLQSTSQTTQSTVQNLKTTQQTLQSTAQRLQSTSQPTQSTLQNLQSTSQALQSTVQNLQSTNQYFLVDTTNQQTVVIPLQSTTQTLKSTSQLTKSTSQQQQQTVQVTKSTSQITKSTSQTNKNTSQTTQSTTQNLRSTSQNLQSTTQVTQSTTQMTQSTSQSAASTSQIVQSTSQLQISTSQVRRSTSQLRSCDSSTELCTPGPVGSCTPGGNITCETVTTGPTLVSSCTNSSASSANNWTSTTCAVTTTGPTPTASCTAASASPSNSYTTTTCNTTTTGPTPVMTCNAASANSGNSYIATTCATNSTGPTPVATCTAQTANSGNNYVTTTCATTNTGPTAVSACSPQSANSGNAYTTTTCNPNNTTNVPVAACSASGPSTANGYTTTTCAPNNTSNVPVATCTASSATAGNGWTTTTCATNNTSATPVSSCTPVSPSSSNGYTTTACTVNNTTNVPSGSCVATAATVNNGWTTTTCSTVTTGPTPIANASCTASTGASGNNWTTTTCPVTNVGPTPVASCSAATASSSNSWTTTTCVTNSTGPTPIASCTAATASSSNAYTATTCATNSSALTAVSSCTPVAASSGNSYTATVCPIATTGPTGVQTCTAATASSSNSWTATTCNTLATGPTAVASCTAAVAGSGNSWTATTCSTNNTSNVQVNSCAAASATSSNNWTATTCPQPTVFSGPTNVGACTASPATDANGHHQTLCNIVISSTPVAAGTCVPQSANSGNNYTAVTCTDTTTGPTPVATCTPQTAASGNSWLQITCGTNNTSNVPVASCIAAAASAANSFTTTTCPPPVTTGPTAVASCTPVTATSGTNWVATTCTTSTTGPTPVSSCTSIPASSGNNWTATNCGSNTTSNVPVATCTNASPTSGNSWVTTTCSNNNTGPTAVSSCAGSAASASNSWTLTTCASSNFNNVPSPSCSATSPTSSNNWTTTTCSTNNTTNVPSGSCVSISASSGNGWTTTTCPTLTSGPTGVSSCSPSAGNAGNMWVTTTCTPNNMTGVPVAACTPATGNSGNGWMSVVCTPNNTTNVPVASCSPGTASPGNSYTTTTCTANNLSTPSGSCVAVSPTFGNGYTTTTCSNVVVGPVGAPSCTPSGPSAGNNWTTTTCPGVATTGPTAVASCTSASANAGDNYTATTCTPVIAGPTVTQNCTPSNANAGNGYVSTTCTPVSGNQEAVTTYTRVQQFDISGGAQSSTGTDVTTTDGPNATGACYAPGTQPALPANGEASWGSADATAYPSCTGWPCQVDTNGGNPRSINSLADVAQYYYVTDLRPSSSWPSTISSDNVPAVGSGAEDDKARWQHMTTFSIALGVSGTIKYVSDYKTSAVSGATDSPPDIRFADIRVGTDTAVPPNVANWPLWPDPTPGYYNDPNNYNDPRAIDDFWHAAVNGRGLYFSAGNPTSVIAGLAGALAGITSRVASSTGAGTSNLEPVTGDNFVYLANYTTQKWTGDVQAHEIDVNTGVIQTPTIWSAQSLLDAKVSNACDNRKIMLFRSGASNNLVNFSWNTLACDGAGNPTGTADTGLNAAEQANFSSTNVSLLSQYPSMTDGTSGTVDQRTPASGANLVNFLRGQRGMENFVTNVAGKLYRGRDHVLGDVVDGQPVYVRAPFATYSDTGYTAFALANASRTPMLYVAANDGMLHAFYAGTSETDPLGGKEAWAVVPSAMLPNLYTLADTNYQNVHRYFVDGTPSVSDVYDGTNWRTLLVGGFNDGGRGFYALDVTDPIHPKGMWEFNWSSTACPSNPSAAAGNTADCHVGLSFGRPVISKLNDGSWVVMVTSGYNNINANPQSGDGGGYLYVLNAVTGQIIYKIPTNVGNATTPSGLAQINNFVDKADVNNLTDWVYGTDLLGNIWRFDVNDNLPPAGREASLVGTATDSTGTPQPITTRPELTQLGDKPMILVATGELLGATDVSNLQTQSVYGFIDPLTGSPAYANLRSALAPLTMAQVGSGTGAYRTIACMGSTAACASSSGWRIDLPDPGERVNVGMKLSSSTLVVGSNVPQISACSAGGYSWLNYLNFSTGLAVSTSANVSVSEQVANSLIVGLTVVKLPSGALKAIVTTSDAGVLTQGIPVGSGSTNAKRVSWREIVSQ